MVWMVAYVAFLVYAVGLMLWCLRHQRHWVAAGIVLSITGYQIATTGVILPAAGIAVAIAGLGCVAYDLAATFLPRHVHVTVRQTPRRMQRHELA